MFLKESLGSVQGEYTVFVKNSNGNDVPLRYSDLRSIYGKEYLEKFIKEFQQYLPESTNIDGEFIIMVLHGSDYADVEKQIKSFNA